mmetsp:Transcript_5248/g.9847  ORF Transcript_5248/g.9847 Transcript_5248/m.9847 type:complete len:225 (-) Transcript_5248:629-1303(-)
MAVDARAKGKGVVNTKQKIEDDLWTCDDPHSSPKLTDPVELEVHSDVDTLGFPSFPVGGAFGESMNDLFLRPSSFMAPSNQKENVAHDDEDEGINDGPIIACCDSDVSVSSIDSSFSEGLNEGQDDIQQLNHFIGHPSPSSISFQSARAQRRSLTNTMAIKERIQAPASFSRSSSSPALCMPKTPHIIAERVRLRPRKESCCRVRKDRVLRASLHSEEETLLSP